LQSPASPSVTHIRGYTQSMKTAVSIPDEVFQGAERIARRTRRSRSDIYAEALREYVARHDPDLVTEAMNRVCEDVGGGGDEFLASASRRILERSKW